MERGGSLQAFQVMRQASALLVSVLLAQSVLSPSEIGIYEQWMFVQYALSFFWISGLVQGFLTYYHRVDPEKRADFAFSAYLTFWAATGVLAGVLLLFRKPVLFALTGHTEEKLFWLFLVYLALNLPTFLQEHFLLLREKPRALLAYGALSFGGAAIAVAGPVWAGYGLPYSFGALICLQAIKQGWLWTELKKSASPKWLPAETREWVLASWPLMVYALLGGLIPTINGWLVNWQYHGDPAMFAIYRYGARELPLATALSEALSAAMIPLAVRNLPEALRETKRRSLRMMHWIFPLSVALLSASKWWYPWVFSPEFREGIPVVNAFFLIVISRMVFPRSFLLAFRANRVLLWISVLELVLLVLLGLLWAPRWGIQGVAWATVTAYFFEKALQVIWLYWRQGISPGQFIPLGWWAFYSVLLGAAYLFALS
ncbi:MAG: hypothetical protein IPH16_10795 [Haliscomenobacter sp.]|nr:hypothetical protein [Haliscomenobacter sp.]